MLGTRCPKYNHFRQELWEWHAFKIATFFITLYKPTSVEVKQYCLTSVSGTPGEPQKRTATDLKSVRGIRLGQCFFFHYRKWSPLMWGSCAAPAFEMWLVCLCFLIIENDCQYQCFHSLAPHLPWKRDVFASVCNCFCLDRLALYHCPFSIALLLCLA